MSINSVISDERGALLDGRQAWVFFVSGNGREGSKDFSRVAKKQLRKILIFLLLYIHAVPKAKIHQVMWLL